MLSVVSQAGAVTTATSAEDEACVSSPFSSSTAMGSRFEVGWVAELGASISMGSKPSVVRADGGVFAVEDASDALTGDGCCDEMSGNGAGSADTAGDPASDVVDSGSLWDSWALDSSLTEGETSDSGDRMVSDWGKEDVVEGEMALSVVDKVLAATSLTSWVTEWPMGPSSMAVEGVDALIQQSDLDVKIPSQFYLGSVRADLTVSSFSFLAFFPFFTVAFSVSPTKPNSRPSSRRSSLFLAMLASRVSSYSLLPHLVRFAEIPSPSADLTISSPESLILPSPFSTSFSSASGVLALDPRLRLLQTSGANW